MLIKNINFENWNDNLLADSKWNPEIGEEFLDKVVAAFAASTPVLNDKGLYSMQKTMEKVVNDKKNINDIQYLNYTLLVKFITKCTRGNLLKNQNKNTRLATYTPLFMYAHKFYNDIPYEKLDKTDKDIKFALGRQLT